MLPAACACATSLTQFTGASYNMACSVPGALTTSEQCLLLAVMLQMTSSYAALTGGSAIELTAALWGANCASSNTVRSRALTDKKLGTWHGMLGCYQKDRDEKHYLAVMSGESSDEDLSVKYCQYGAGDLKCRVVISVDSSLEQRFTFYTLQ